MERVHASTQRRFLRDQSRSEPAGLTQDENQVEGGSQGIGLGRVEHHQNPGEAAPTGITVGWSG